MLKTDRENSRKYEPPPRGERDEPNEAVIARSRYYLESHHRQDGHDIPTIPGLCTSLRLPVSCILGWRDRADISEACAEFDEVCALIEGKLHHLLLHDDLEMELSPSVATLALQSLYDYTKNRQVTGDDGGPVRISLDSSNPEDVARNYRKIMRHGNG